MINDFGGTSATTVGSIPSIMLQQGWVYGERLLQTWLSRNAAVAPSYGPSVTNVIKMEWVLKFTRAREVFDSIISKHAWTTPKAKQEIGRMLRKLNLLTVTPQTVRFGNLAAHVQLLDFDYVTYGVVNFGVTDLDDLTAALGNFTFRIAVAGGITPISPSKHHIMIDQVGIYVRDSFDFNGEQSLGFWDASDNSVSMINPMSGTAISNADFRSWRATAGKGGDFLAYSDVKRVRLAKPDEFDV